MSEMAATTQGRSGAPLRDLRRDPEAGMLGGVCAGLGRHLDVDPLLLRIGFFAMTLASGVGALAYALAWLMLPAENAQARAATAAARAQTTRGRRAAAEVAAGAGFLLIAVLLAFRELGLPFSDLLIWPLTLVAAGGALIWRQSVGAPGAREAAPPVTAAATATAPAPPVAPASPIVISWVGIGVTLVITAAVVFLQVSGALAAAADVALVALVVVIAVAVIFAPFVVRLLTSLSAERAERIRSQERAEVAAHLHDSVLQTLALVQKRAGNPREVAALARRQERELRTWLTGAPVRDVGERWLVGALQAAAEQIDEAHGIAVEVVAVGDAPLDRAGEALVAAAREAMLNAAKFGDGSAVAVYVEAGDERLEVFVRDRGPGFDPAAIPEDRRGVRESIIGRMQRHGGRVAITASPGGGTEVELVLERSAS